MPLLVYAATGSGREPFRWVASEAGDDSFVHLVYSATTTNHPIVGVKMYFREQLALASLRIFLPAYIHALTYVSM